MGSNAHSFITPVNYTASAIVRRADREERRRELIHTLRRLAALASLEHYDEPSSAQRARWARLVGKVDERLRKLCNEGRTA